MTVTPQTSKPTRLSVLRKVFSLLPWWEKTAVWLLIFAVLTGTSINAVLFYNHHTVILPKTGGEISFGLVGQPALLNPILASSKTDISINRIIFSGLYTYNASGELIPDLAESVPTPSEDGKSYTISLSPDSLWHDGAPVTTKDVLFTISKIQDPEIDSPLRSLWLSTEVKTQDLYTLTFILKEANPAFLHNLTFGLLPEHTWKNVSSSAYSSSPLTQKPLGNGPFALRQIKRDKTGSVNEILLEKFAGHKQPAFLQSLQLKFFTSYEELVSAQNRGAIQTAGFSPSENFLTDFKTLNLSASVLYPTYQALYFNTKSDLLSSTEVRQALASAVDWQKVLDTWQSGLRPISGTPLGMDKNPFESYFSAGDPQTLLKKAGYRQNNQKEWQKNGTKLALTLALRDTAPFPDIAKIIQTSWLELGVQVELELLPLESLIAEKIRPRNYDALLFFQTSSMVPEAFAFWHSSQALDPGINITQLESAQLDGLITTARSTIDDYERGILYTLIQQSITEQAPAVFYGQSKTFLLANPKILGVSDGYLPDQTWLLQLLRYWHLNTSRAWQG